MSKEYDLYKKLNGLEGKIADEPTAAELPRPLPSTFNMSNPRCPHVVIPDEEHAECFKPEFLTLAQWTNPKTIDNKAAFREWLDSGITAAKMARHTRDERTELAKQFMTLAREVALELRKKIPSLGKLPEGVPADPWREYVDLIVWLETEEGAAPQVDVLMKARFTFAPGQCLFDNIDLKLPTGVTLEVAEKLVKAFGRTVTFKVLDDNSREFEASEQLRKAISLFRKALQNHEVPCQVTTKTRMGYLVEPQPSCHA